MRGWRPGPIPTPPSPGRSTPHGAGAASTPPTRWATTWRSSPAPRADAAQSGCCRHSATEVDAVALGGATGLVLRADRPVAAGARLVGDVQAVVEELLGGRGRIHLRG